MLTVLDMHINQLVDQSYWNCWSGISELLVNLVGIHGQHNQNSKKVNIHTYHIEIVICLTVYIMTKGNNQI